MSQDGMRCPENMDGKLWNREKKREGISHRRGEHKTDKQWGKGREEEARRKPRLHAEQREPKHPVGLSDTTGSGCRQRTVPGAGMSGWVSTMKRGAVVCCHASRRSPFCPCNLFHKSLRTGWRVLFQMNFPRRSRTENSFENRWKRGCPGAMIYLWWKGKTGLSLSCKKQKNNRFWRNKSPMNHEAGRQQTAVG